MNLVRRVLWPQRPRRDRSREPKQQPKAVAAAVLLSMLAVFVLLPREFCRGQTGKADETESAGRQKLPEDILHNVRVNEAAYKNVEVVYTARYRNVYARMQAKPLDPLSAETQYRTVLQNGMYYIKTTSTEVYDDGSQRSSGETRGFDGQTTTTVRMNRDNAADNPQSEAFIRNGGESSFVRVLRPHTLVRWRHYIDPAVSFADVLAGRPEHKMWLRQNVVSLGREDVDGLKCEKILLEVFTSASNKKPDYCFYWLAIDRNYIPVKFAGCNAGDMMTTAAGVAPVSEPVEETAVTDLREIKPGVWLPYTMKKIVYDLGPGKKERTVNNVTEIAIEKWSLDPQYDVSLFRDIEIPPDTPVTEIKNGRVVNSYTFQAPQQRAEITRRYFWLIPINVALVVLIAVLWMRSRKHPPLSGDS